MDVTHGIVKVYVTVRNDVIKRQSNVIIIWRTSTTEVTALLKHLRSEMKGVQEKESIIGVRGRQKKYVPRDHSLAYARQSSLGRNFLSTPNTMIDP